MKRICKKIRKNNRISKIKSKENKGKKMEKKRIWIGIKKMYKRRFLKKIKEIRKNRNRKRMKILVNKKRN